MQYEGFRANLCYNHGQNFYNIGPNSLFYQLYTLVIYSHNKIDWSGHCIHTFVYFAGRYTRLFLYDHKYERASFITLALWTILSAFSYSCLNFTVVSIRLPLSTLIFLQPLIMSVKKVISIGPCGQFYKHLGSYSYLTAAANRLLQPLPSLPFSLYFATTINYECKSSIEWAPVYNFINIIV
jgi:hypothetical protein